MKQGGAEGGGQTAPHLRPEQDAWWISFDEDYWHALLEQGEFVTGIVPSAGPEEFADPFALDWVAGLEGRTAAVPDEHDSPAVDEWQAARLALERGDLFHVSVSGANRGGVLISWNGRQGFVPASHLTEPPRSPDPEARISELTGRIGDPLAVRLIEVDEQQNRLVFSERAAATGAQSPDAILGSLSSGDLCRGRITNLTSFGAFVDLGGIEGLVHISEISWDRVQHPSDVLHPKQEVEVEVLGVNPEERRIALSLKRLRQNPWANAEQRYQAGQIVEGTVTNVVSFGAFVRVEEGIEGLVHTSELAEGSFMHPRNVIREGDVVRVRVLDVNGLKHRLALSLRQAQE